MTYLNGIFIFILVMAILYLLNEAARFALCFKDTKPYVLDDRRKALLFADISYIITFIAVC